MQACGHVYLDEGKALSTATTRDDLLACDWLTAAGSSGSAGQVPQLLSIDCNITVEGLLDDTGHKRC